VRVLAGADVGVAPVFDVLIGVVVGLFGSVFVQVLLQAILIWREQQERARSVRLAPLDSLLPVVDAVVELMSQLILFAEFRSRGIAYPYSEKLLDLSLNAITRVQRAGVSVLVIDAPPEISAALTDVGRLLASVVNAPEEQLAALLDGIRDALSQIEDQYMSLKLRTDKLVLL